MRASTKILAIGIVMTCSACSEDMKRPEQITFGGDRPTQLHVPDDYDPAQKTPLLMVLHGHRASSYLQLSYTRTRDLPDQVGTLMLAPDGLLGGDGQPSWNASDICCGMNENDDVGYLTGLIEEVAEVWNVDRDRIYLFGHSNGGFMSYRLACERADLFAGIASLAGAGYEGCVPSDRVSILQIHGDMDEAVDIGGGSFGGGEYLSAQASLDAWSGYNGCADDWQDGDPLDIEVDLEGAETAVRYNAGCDEVEVGVELWTIQNGSHVPGFSDDFPMQLWGWLSQHSK